MVQLAILSTLLLAGAVGVLARPQDPTPTPSPGAKPEEGLRSSFIPPGVEAVVNTYNLAEELQDVHLMLHGDCHFLPYSKGKLTYVKPGRVVRAYVGSSDFCNCTEEASPTIFQFQDVMYGVPAPYWCMNVL